MLLTFQMRHKNSLRKEVSSEGPSRDGECCDMKSGQLGQSEETC